MITLFQRRRRFCRQAKSTTRWWMGCIYWDAEHQQVWGRSLWNGKPAARAHPDRSFPLKTAARPGPASE